MARPYQKRSDYWNQGRKAQAQVEVPQPTVAIPTMPSVPFPDIAYGSTEVAYAGQVPQSTASVRGGQINQPGSDPGAFQNIRAFSLPWAGYGDSRGYIGIQGAVELCSRCYTGFAPYRNAVEVSVEFSNQPLVIKCKNQTVKTFFTEWFSAIQIHKLKEEFFREYYRSGNVFLYKFSGKFGPSYYKHMQQSFGMKDNRVPIRYSLLNPANVFVPSGLTYPYTYVRLLSTYEIERLRNPMTEQDKQVYQDMPQFVKDQIKVTSGFPLGIYIPLEPERLRFAFYKKQSYEPLATPMGYPVMGPIEWKLSLEKMDMALARTVEHCILLITNGETATKENGGKGINPNNIARLQNLLTNQTVGRVLVADYTTKAEWLVPEISDILGPEKYQIVNQDIAEGLQSILGGNDKFANAQMKAKIFIQRLKEGQDAFLNDFLMTEVVQVCDVMGFRTVPEIKFRKINLQDETLVARIIAQLGTIGILTAGQVVNAIETGVLPDQDEMDEAQIAYTKARKKGQYLPLVGASMQDAPPGGAPQPGQGPKGAGGPGGRPAGTKGISQTTKNVSPIGTKSGVSFSVKRLGENLRAYDRLQTEVDSALMRRFKVKTLAEPQLKVSQSLARAIMATNSPAKWSKAVAGAIKQPPAIPAEVGSALDDIGSEYKVDPTDAILLYHAQRE